MMTIAYVNVMSGLVWNRTQFANYFDSHCCTNMSVIIAPITNKTVYKLTELEINICVVE